jgi:hypothetical protein
MTLSFAAILSLGVAERVNSRLGAILLWPLLIVGLFSLLLWRWTDDLRLYFWAQFFPCLALLLLFVLYPPKYTGTRYWIIAARFTRWPRSSSFPILQSFQRDTCWAGTRSSISRPPPHALRF